MDCRDARRSLTDYLRGTAEPEASSAVRTHLEGCPACAREAAAEQALTEALDRRLPQFPASPALKRRLAGEWNEAPEPRPAAWARWRWRVLPAAAAALILLTAVPLYFAQGLLTGRSGGAAGMVSEAVNDHVRILQRPQPLDVESRGIHDVKPWFASRLDFAPTVTFAGDEDFPLRGGAVGYFIDRPAAVFVYGRRLHTISLLVFRADGLPWPVGAPEGGGAGPFYRRDTRGFHVILWRAGEIGYALVSDVEAPELLQLASRLTNR
jgi:anti-sigma factor (TIGR02949 family)